MDMPDLDPDQILATISPSAPRRIMGIVVLATLGTALLYLALAKPPGELHWQVFLLVLGATTMFLADAMRRATAVSLELTPEVLRETSGRIVARVANIDAVERGAFAIKPSNGFLLRLLEPETGNAWAPGLWWRLGRRVGVGGITSAAEAKNVAEILASLSLTRKVAQARAAEDADR